jgi:hypothetical protein
MSTGGSTESNVRSFYAFLAIYLSIITRNTVKSKKKIRVSDFENVEILIFIKM